MAKTFILADDLDGTQDDTVQTITWAFNGQGFEIDLTSANLAKFERAVSRFQKVSREISRIQLSARAGDSETSKIRAWATEHQDEYAWEIGEKGRISQEIRDAYHQAMKDAESPKTDNDDNHDDDSDDEE